MPIRNLKPQKIPKKVPNFCQSAKTLPNLVSLAEEVFETIKFYESDFSKRKKQS